MFQFLPEQLQSHAQAQTGSDSRSSSSSRQNQDPKRRTSSQVKRYIYSLAEVEVTRDILPSEDAHKGGIYIVNFKPSFKLE